LRRSIDEAAVAYDEKLADRVRKIVGPDVTEKKMFGGLAFLLDGKMFCGIAKEDLMVRVGPDAYEAALAEPHVRPMDFTGRPMNGYVFVGPAGCRTEKQVRPWVEGGAAFVSALGGSSRAATRRRRKSPR
jgi:TfoX/Sxy family transcriptional regulator of competence genes